MSRHVFNPLSLTKKIILASIASVILSTIIIFANPQTSHAHTISDYTNIDNFAACSGEGTTLFGLPAWHKYICTGDEIEIDFEENPGQIWLIGVAILEILVRAAGTIAFFYIVYSGMRITTSQGDSQGIADARRGLIGSLIGLGIAIVAVGTINFLGNTFGAGQVNETTGLADAPAAENVIAQAAGIFVTIIGAISVIYGALGAFRYVYGAGDTQQVSQARRTIVYAIIGLVISILAGSIIGFVIGRTEGI